MELVLAFGAGILLAWVFFRLTQEPLKRQRYRLARLMERFHDGIIVLGDNDEVLLANQRAFSFLGIGGNDPKMALYRVLKDHPDLSGYLKDVRQGRAPDEITLSMGNASSRHLRVQASVMDPPRSRGAGALLVTLTDITRLQRLEAVRRRFTADLAHQLRTPVTGIRLLSEALRDPAVSVPDHADRILREAARLEVLVDEILTLSRLEAGEQAFRPEVFPISVLIREAKASVAPQTNDKNIRIEVEQTAGEHWRGDYRWLLRTLEIFLENAVKFSPNDATIWIRTYYEEEHLVLTVRDQGPGLSEDDAPHVFHRFYKGAHGAGTHGFGLGLAIAKHAVAAHGGEVFVQTKEGAGSTFGFRLPLG